MTSVPAATARATSPSTSAVSSSKPKSPKKTLLRSAAKMPSRTAPVGRAAAGTAAAAAGTAAAAAAVGESDSP